VDVCGENGEFTFTFDGPLFSNLYFWERWNKIWKKTNK
jgi:diphthamide synthase (EF-2-diphthine--ammonia ligase)